MKRVFIVGFPRSGTTLVQNEIVRRTNLISFTESHYFFERYITPLSRSQWLPIWFDCIGFPRLWCARHDHFSEFYADNKILRANISARRELPANFVRSLDRVASANLADGWIEKTPFHIRRIRKIEFHIPDAVFIHVVRKAKNVKGSWSRLHDDPRSAMYFQMNSEALERAWMQEARRTAYYAKRWPDRHCVVTLEMIQDNPSSTISAIADWLGVDILENKNDTVIGINSFESWKSSNKKATIRQSDYVDSSESRRSRNLYQELADIALSR